MSGLVLSSGSALFLVGVFFPVTLDVFGSLGDPQAMAAAIDGHEVSWLVANILLGVGAVVVGIGLLLLARDGIVGGVAGAAAVLGALLYGVDVVRRVAGSPEDAATAILDPGWTSAVGVVLVHVALIGVGLVVVRSRQQRWVGWLLSVVGTAALLTFLVTGDIAPAFYVSATFIAGVALIFSRGVRTSSRTAGGVVPQ